MAAMKGLEPSLLDKLFDENPRRGMSPEPLRAMSVEQYKETVARDLEGLLNSRSPLSESELKDFPECRKSVMNYGLVDFSSMSLANAYDRAAICMSLEDSISRHERRLKNVKVHLDEHSALGAGLHFTIHAILDIYPAHEAVSFDAVLQPTTFQYSVSKLARSKVDA